MTSASGLRQMLPLHTKRTRGIVFATRMQFEAMGERTYETG